MVLVGLSACECTVNPDVDPLAIIVEPATLTLTAGGERGTLIARRIVSGEDVTALVTWNSGDPNVASVEAGQVSGMARGASTITAQIDGFSAGADVDVTVACVDGLKNGEESDVDCGGPFCAPCALGHTCNGANDCLSSSCVSGICVAQASCFDGVRNGSESSVDCGGHGCAACGRRLALQRRHRLPLGRVQQRALPGAVVHRRRAERRRDRDRLRRQHVPRLRGRHRVRRRERLRLGRVHSRRLP